MSTIPDPLVAAPHVYKLLMENDRVRVFDVQFKPGDKAAMHIHPDHVAYALTDAKLRLSFPDGNSAEVDVKGGQAFWIEAGPHETENIGGTHAHNVVVELKP